ncbi:RHS repeat-associated core domain-containing protein [Flavivirga jejuensis]|uniref:RHS repeat-associated core domain-containing protein n=1 Tax=Flavivirga jejuensis TaxID=870487 RepID=A0ABT8WNK6_9FLAO|nr:RHS repeat-associated core domain-containing protein [Flavivirga jejuensis]MDO5974517.1 RHS repeat-associated core domain-containing protein [Flavivirga jejuensis]
MKRKSKKIATVLFFLLINVTIGFSQCYPIIESTNEGSIEAIFENSYLQSETKTLDYNLQPPWCNSTITYSGWYWFVDENNEQISTLTFPDWFTINVDDYYEKITITCNQNTTGQLRYYFVNVLFEVYEEGNYSVTDYGPLYITIVQDPESNGYTWYPDSDGDSFGDYNKDGIIHTSNSSPPSEYTSYVNNNDDRCPDDYHTTNNGCETGYVYENNNWIIAKTYNINGTLKTYSKAYFNEFGKGTQNQTLDAKTGRIWANQTLYDTQGRPALSTLSAPVNESGVFLHKSGFMKNNIGFNYNNADFETDPENPSSVGTATNTLGRYYSELNDDDYEEGNDYQDITDYPFYRTIYSELNSGTALKVLGGNKINGEWKHGYTFSMPAGNELSQSAAFNDPSYTVSDTRKIVKTISRDVHDTEVVVFTDSDGKTLAAARVGGTLNPNKTTITIREQGFVDVHIPKGTIGFNINPVSGITTEVYDLITEQITTKTTNSLSSGFYRVSVTNLDNYDPTTNPVTIDCNNNYYDYSLNEYDDAGRLTASYQPVGNTKAEKPVTTYNYNVLGQLTNTTSPDGGTATFKYRKDGQIRFSQNSKQALAGEFSYTDYDDLGRPIESGVAVGDFNNLDPDAATFTASSKKEQQYTDYDDLESSDLSVLSGVTGNYSNPKFLAGNVAKTKNNNTTTWYSYDVYGRVEWIVQDITGLGIKTIDYTYDPITGVVTQVDYQKNVSAERFIHRYTYDTVDNSLVKVETSTNGTAYTTHADYEYYETGLLKRIEIATLNGTPLQGIDYVYNLNGQLKSINHPSLAATDDPGKDSNDLFGMQIDYHKNDYTRPTSNIETTTYGEDQYNGNIKGVRWNNDAYHAGTDKEAVYEYRYNKNNWLTDANFGSYSPPLVSASGNTDKISTAVITNGDTLNIIAKSSITLQPNFHAQAGSNFSAKIVTGEVDFQSNNNDYDVTSITYDANGNIQTLKRNKNGGIGNNAMDNLTYTYKTDKPNQLLRVDDAAGEVLAGKDIGDQDGENYEYNEIGQLVKNNEEGIEYVYNASGLVTEIKKNDVTLVKFFYNDKGHRVKKESYISGNINYTEHYIRDAAGTALAIYRDGQVTEHNIYGANRLGVYYRAGSHSVYQITDHLGNVRAVVERAGSTAVAVVNTDYYPFGMPMPNRNVEGNYRYGYQGEFAEKEPEIGSGINSFQLRLYDSRIGRWISPDPYGEFHSPYLAMGNNPASNIDPSGGCINKSGRECEYSVLTGKATGAGGHEWTKDFSNGVSWSDSAFKDYGAWIFRTDYKHEPTQTGAAIPMFPISPIDMFAQATLPNLIEPDSNNQLAILAVTIASKGKVKPTTSVSFGKQLLLAPVKTHKHHIFNKFRGNNPATQKYRDFFKKHKIKVDDHTIKISAETHKKIHAAGNNWTTKWKKWIDKNPNASTKDVYQQGGKMLDEYGVNHVPIIKY